MDLLAIGVLLDPDGAMLVRAARVPPADVIGTAVELEVDRGDTGVQLVRQPRLLGSPNEGAPKPIRIQEHIGQRAILAAGNSAGDREMLEYTASGPRPSLCLLVDHDDPEREYAYESTSLSDPTAEPITTTQPATSGRSSACSASGRRCSVADRGRERPCLAARTAR